MKMMFDFSAGEADVYLIITLSGNRVHFRWGESSFTLKRTTGVNYLLELLLHPYQSITASSLYALVNHRARIYSLPEVDFKQENGEGAFHNLITVPQADGKTLREIKLRVNVINAKIAEAEEWNDLARLEELKLERDSLLDYLKENLNVQAMMKEINDSDYKCADNVYHALQNALNNINKSCPELGKLLYESMQIWANLLFTPPDDFSGLIQES